MTLITQFDDKKSEDGRLAIKSRVHCPAFNIDEDPVVSPLVLLHDTHMSLIHRAFKVSD